MSEKFDPSTPVTFPRGMYELNDEPHINYQLNRIVNWDGGDLEELFEVGPGIHTFSDWKRVLTQLGDRAMGEGRTKNALGYYLMRDFYTSYDDPDKIANYHQAQEVFYDYYREVFSPANGGAPIVERLSVPYEGGVTLPVFHATPEGESRGTILMHGGNDSYMEEFINLFCTCASTDTRSICTRDLARARSSATRVVPSPGSGRRPPVPSPSASASPTSPSSASRWEAISRRARRPSTSASAAWCAGPSTRAPGASSRELPARPPSACWGRSSMRTSPT